MNEKILTRESVSQLLKQLNCKADKVIDLLEGILENIDRQSKIKFFREGKSYLIPLEICKKHMNDTNFDWLKDWEVSSDKKILSD